MKTEQEILASSMAEDDPRVVCVNEEETKDPRWGRNHKGAKILANFYSRGNFKFLYDDSCHEHRSMFKHAVTTQNFAYTKHPIIILLQ